MLKELAVVTSPTSYLQTLDKNEAIAFVASLQKVKEHLNHELQWITTQAEQKTTQLQGIEAILIEAVTLGLITNLPSDSAASNARVTDLSSEVSLSSSNGGATLADSNPTDTENELIVATDSKSDRRKGGGSKPKSATQPSKVKKPRTSQAKSTSAARKSTSKANTSKSPDLKHFVRAEFQEQSFTDAVFQILETSSEPIGLSDVIAKLYGDLSSPDYQRAKISLTNVLSTGKNKGKWKSIGRGMYASNAVAAAL